MAILVIATTKKAPGFQPLCEDASEDEMIELIPGWLNGARKREVTGLQVWTRNWEIDDPLTAIAAEVFKARKPTR